MSAYLAALELIRAADQYRLLRWSGRDNLYDGERLVTAHEALSGGTWPPPIERWRKGGRR